MITDEMLHERHDDLEECLLGLMEKFQAEKGKVAEAIYAGGRSDSEIRRLTGQIIGIIDCIIILKDELRRMGLIDDEDTKMVDQDRAVAP